jgi:RHS repeat-associated protein
VRTRKTAGGHATRYVLDLATTLPVVISDTDGVYLYGLDILAQQQAERQYYMHDGLGSVRQLVDTTGQIETNYAYDPFGVPVMGGDGSNAYQFTGEAWDAEVELLYLRARYYQPEVGRFITRDPLRANLRVAQSFNRYIYTANNPVNKADPAGLRGEEPPPVAIWTTREMVNNVQSATLKTIYLLNLMSRNPLLGISSRASKLSALALFGWMVRTDGPWDPKGEIRRRSYPPKSQQIGQYWYFYDVWGNVMYGYLGTAAEFSESELLNGAGLEQIGSDVYYCVDDSEANTPCALPHPKCGWSNAVSFRTWDYPEDQVKIKIGVRLWRQHNINVQPQHLVDEIVDAGDRGEIPRQLKPWEGEEGPMQWQS